MFLVAGRSQWWWWSGGRRAGVGGHAALHTTAAAYITSIPSAWDLAKLLPTVPTCIYSLQALPCVTNVSIY
jgi:hypothetical protein